MLSQLRGRAPGSARPLSDTRFPDGKTRPDPLPPAPPQRTPHTARVMTERADRPASRRRRLALPRSSIVAGHEIGGRINAIGEGASQLAIDERVGVFRLGHSCRDCPYSPRAARESVRCPLFTGDTRDGGFAMANTRFGLFCAQLASIRQPDAFAGIAQI
jgi:hypothetical protein